MSDQDIYRQLRQLKKQVDALAARVMDTYTPVGRGYMEAGIIFLAGPAGDIDAMPRLGINMRTGSVNDPQLTYSVGTTHHTVVTSGNWPTNIVILDQDTDGYIWSNAGSAEIVKCTWDETTVPTVNDDSGDGFAIRSLWLDVSADHAYMCLDATAGAAVWRLLTEAITVTPAAAGFNAPIPIGLGQAG